MLFKEDIEQPLKDNLNSFAINGDTIRALTELYNSLPSREYDTCNKVEVPVKVIDKDIIPDDKLTRENDFLTHKSTKHELQDLADELNKAEPIDWYNDSQEKYSIKFNFINKELWTDLSYSLKGLDIYSTDNCFLEKAKERIGEDRLITLFEKEM